MNERTKIDDKDDKGETTMKKFLAVILAVALRIPLNMSAMAQQETGYSAAGTDVKFMVDSSQISVTVPLTLAATVNAATGAITWPAATSYTMENKSAFAVKVSTVTCTVESGWTLVTAATGTDDIIATVSPDGGTTKVNLLTAAETCTGAEWNMAADGAGTDVLELTLDGRIGTPGAKTQALTTTEATAFTITFTVEAGANS